MINIPLRAACDVHPEVPTPRTMRKYEQIKKKLSLKLETKIITSNLTQKYLLVFIQKTCSLYVANPTSSGDQQIPTGRTWGWGKIIWVHQQEKSMYKYA